MKFVKKLFFISLLFTTLNMKIFADHQSWPNFSANFYLDVALKNSDELAIYGAYRAAYRDKVDTYGIRFKKRLLRNDHSAFCFLSVTIKTKDKKHKCGQLFVQRDSIDSNGMYKLHYSYFAYKSSPNTPHAAVCNNSEIQLAFHNLSLDEDNPKDTSSVDLGVTLEEQSLMVPATSNAKFQIQISSKLDKTAANDETNADDETDKYDDEEPSF